MMVGRPSFLVEMVPFLGTFVHFQGKYMVVSKICLGIFYPGIFGERFAARSQQPRKHSGKLTQTWKIHYFHWSYQEGTGFSMVMLVYCRVVVLLIYAPGAT